MFFIILHPDHKVSSKNYLLQLIAFMCHVWMVMTSIQSNNADHKAAETCDDRPMLEHQQDVSCSEVEHRNWQRQWYQMVEFEFVAFREISDGSKINSSF